MNVRVWRLALSIVLALAAPSVHSSSSLRCDGGLVRDGDSPRQVEQACGEPDYRFYRAAVDIPKLGIVESVREWFYNFGAQRFIRVLYFRGDELDRIGKAGYGFSYVPARSCDPYVLEIGISKFELVSICGEPDIKESRYRLVSGHGVQRVDRWVYRFGSRHFPRELEFIDGRLDDVERVDE